MPNQKSARGIASPPQPDRFQNSSNQLQPQEVAAGLVIPVAVVAGAGVLLVTVGATGVALNWKDTQGTVTQLGELAYQGVENLAEATQAIFEMVVERLGDLASNQDLLEKLRQEVAKELRRIPGFETGQINSQQHSQPNSVPDIPQQTPGFDEGYQTEGDRNTGGISVEEREARDYVMEERISKPSEMTNNFGPAREGYQRHHIIPDAVAQRSPLVQEAIRRGLYNLDRASNLIYLPSKKDTYDQSNIKILHRGRHNTWSEHARRILDRAQQSLIQKHGSLDKVPKNKLQQNLDEIEQDLRKDLLDVQKGLNNNWLKRFPDGYNRLSLNESFLEQHSSTQQVWSFEQIPERILDNAPQSDIELAMTSMWLADRWLQEEETHTAKGQHYQVERDSNSLTSARKDGASIVHIDFQKKQMTLEQPFSPDDISRLQIVHSTLFEAERAVQSQAAATNDGFELERG